MRNPAKKQLLSDEQPASELVLLCDREAVVTNDAQAIASDISRNVEQPEQFYDSQPKSHDTRRAWDLAREQAETIRHPKPSQVVHPSLIVARTRLPRANPMRDPDDENVA